MKCRDISMNSMKRCDRSPYLAPAVRSRRREEADAPCLTEPYASLRRRLRSGPLRHFILAALACFAAVLWMSTAPAQILGEGALPPQPPRPAVRVNRDKPAEQKDHRFLFVVDTSLSMRADAGPARQAVTDLLKSSMQGQMRDGDTLGVWTYDEE